jgi:hypothetical protein
VFFDGLRADAKNIGNPARRKVLSIHNISSSNTQNNEHVIQGKK